MAHWTPWTAETLVVEEHVSFGLSALRLARDLELDLAAVALVMDLLAEIDRLRSRPPSW